MQSLAQAGRVLSAFWTVPSGGFALLAASWPSTVRRRSYRHWPVCEQDSGQ